LIKTPSTSAPQISHPKHATCFNAPSVGAFLQELSEKNWVVTGVDLSVEMIDGAKQRNVPDVSLLHGSVSELPRKQSYDLITAVMVLQFVNDLEPILTALNGKLRDGGLFVVAVHNEIYIQKCLDAKYKFRYERGQLKIGFGDGPGIPMVSDAAYRIDQFVQRELDWIPFLTCKPEFVKEYLNLPTRDSREPIDVPKFSIHSFIKKSA